LVVKLAPSDGAVIEIVGGVFATVIEVVVDVVAPSASVTLAVMTCAPFESLRVNVPPVPIEPSRLDVHRMEPVREP
jgi:hypothetical protein